MKLQHLRFAQAVFEAGSFSGAAKACHVTQPTLSAGIAQLEDRLGGKLFERTTRSVTATAFGNHLRPLIEDVSTSERLLTEGADAVLNPAHQLVRIAMTPLIDIHTLAEALTPYRQAHPKAEIVYKECFLDDLGERLARGTIDIALLPDASADALPPGYEVVPLYTDSLKVVPKSGLADPGLAGRPLSIAALTDETLVLTPNVCGLVLATERLFAANGLSLRVYPGQALSYQVMAEWADLGLGTAILPASKIPASHRHMARPLTDAGGTDARIGFSAVWRKHATNQPHIKALREHFRTVAPAILSGSVRTLPLQNAGD